MGTYATTTTLETLWGGPSFANITATASQMITQAENEVDKMLSGRYDMSSGIFQTASSVPPMVTTLTEWLSLGYLYEVTARGSKDSYARADRFINKATKNMEKILDYEVNLVDSSGDLIPGDSTDLQILGGQEDYHRTFNEDDPLNWSPDSDKIDDIADER